MNKILRKILVVITWPFFIIHYEISVYKFNKKWYPNK